jgi:hypothetical protein
MAGQPTVGAQNIQYCSKEVKQKRRIIGTKSLYQNYRQGFEY